MITRDTKGRIYAIGDIHGCYKEIFSILKHLKSFDKITQEDQVIFLGDYIDRGPDNVKTLDLLIKFKKDFPKTIFLRGNHEDMFLGFLNLGGSYGNMWAINGGEDLINEYGIRDLVHLSMEGSTFVEKHDLNLILATIPKEHLEFIKATERIAEVNGVIFVHAGLNPNKSIEGQSNEDLFWIREGFLHRDHKFGRAIVHGHTISKFPYFNLPYEVSIDTGCFQTRDGGYEADGALTCLKIRDATHLISADLLMVKAGTHKVIVNPEFN